MKNVAKTCLLGLHPNTSSRFYSQKNHIFIDTNVFSHTKWFLNWIFVQQNRVIGKYLSTQTSSNWLLSYFFTVFLLNLGSFHKGCQNTQNKTYLSNTKTFGGG